MVCDQGVRSTTKRRYTSIPFSVQLYKTEDQRRGLSTLRDKIIIPLISLEP